ncbi:MAG: uncharacterized protein JWO32_1369 [Bacteroidetes bacterium]|nr:uncharacterized protein [Bacteroidota bacterium]
MVTLKNITTIFYRYFLFSVRDVFISTEKKTTADINYFIQVPDNIDSALSEFFTLLIDLNKNENDIWSNIYIRTQTEILSFINNQHFRYNIHYSPTPRDLEYFIGLLERFVKHKKIRKAEVLRLKAYNTNGILAISYIEQNHEFLCINFYRVTLKRATNLYSFTLKHECKTKYTSTHFGRGHRAHHWLDIKTFKKLGVNFYDFGGWYNGSDDHALLNINKFKEQFTRTLIKEYSGVIYKNIFLKFLKRLVSHG